MDYGESFYFKIKDGDMAEIDLEEYEESIKERKKVDLYQLFREYSGIDICYNEFLPLLEEFKLKLKQEQKHENR